MRFEYDAPHDGRSYRLSRLSDDKETIETLRIWILPVTKVWQFGLTITKSSYGPADNLKEGK